ncbi:MAG: acyl-CoA dehydrogenase [Boseongicola sp. SB0673_bin_14]|nr:acyl-CoA dehydrogenase [Boseongicola sp. SB0667_bin_21]MYI70714.1 acyl-CoA dehydrogenase [Boseongicola sp. SB0673_bin_14]
MDFGLSDVQRLLIGTVRRFVDDELRPLEQPVEDSGYLEPESAEAIQAKSRAIGLYAMNMPEELGGGGLSTMDWMLVEEEFGRTTDILIRRAFGNVYDILLAGSEVQKERWLIPAIHGDRTFSIAFTEAEAGSDAAAIRTRSTPTDDGWSLTGQKQFISDAHHSDFYVLTAVTDPRAGARGISTFVVDRDMPGVTLGPDVPMMGLRGTTHAELTFENVILGPEHLLGEDGGGLKLALGTLGRVRLAQVGARAVGKAAMLLEMAVEHARSRHQFGQPIGDFQSVGQMLADSAVEINAARLALWQAAWMLDQGKPARTQISVVKLQASETLGRVADRALQIFGGSGYSKELAVERHYRDARVYRIFDGTSEIHRNVIARNLLAGDDGYKIPA